ncbi:hypothetical protein GCM10027051_02700 [Niabella terrae]
MKRNKLLYSTLLITGFWLLSCQKVTELYEELDRPYFGIADAYKLVEFNPAAQSRLVPVATNIDTAEWKNRITHKDTTGWCAIRHTGGALELTVTSNSTYNRMDTVTVTTTTGKSLSFRVFQEGPQGTLPEE